MTAIAPTAPFNGELYTLGRFLRQTFGYPVHKLPIDAGFTCPNLDGTKGTGGCAYCNNRSFSLGLPHRRQSVREQLHRQRDRVLQSPRRRAQHFLAYFQSFTNTYGPVEHLQALYDEALAVPDVVGLDISTRPDCVPDPVLDLLETYGRTHHVWLELGLESSHDRTLDAINRGHHWAAFEDALGRASGRGLHLCVHLILGLPGETPEMIRATGDRLGRLMAEINAPALGIKLHHLHIVKGTALAQAYHRGEVALLTPDRYVPLVCDVLERLPANTVIHRFMGDTLGDTLIAPHWPCSKAEVQQRILAEFAQRQTGPGWRIGNKGQP